MKLYNQVKKHSNLYAKKGAVLVGAVSLAASGSVMALDADTNTAITAAGTAGAASVGLSATAIITIVVAMVGVGLVIAVLKRS